MATRYTFHISPSQVHIKPDISGSAHTFQYHQITQWCGIVWCRIWCDVECFAMPDHARCCALFILMWLWCAIKCDVEYMRYGVMCNGRCVVKYGDAILNDGVIHGEYSGVLMQDVKCGCGIPIWNGWNAAWCGLECVLWGSAICNLYLNAMFMAESGRDLMWLWFDVMLNVIEMRQKVWCGWRGVESWNVA